jgi:uncharacterized membrane protein YphA (DoxX/SURF4 family)
VNIALWIVQVLLGGLFIFAGGFKLTLPTEELVQASGMPGWFILFISVVELLGGIGLLVPALTGIKPWLTPLAAAGLAVIMIGATVVSLPQGIGALMPAVIGALCAFVAYGRVRVAPHRARR